MAGFEDRLKQFEAQYGRDQELRFRVNVRRNRLLGQWAAEEMGLTGDAAAAYATSVVESDFDRPGDADVVQKVLGDLVAKGIDIDERRLRRRMDELLETAKRQIMAE